MRLFVAIELPDAVLDALAAVQQQMQRNGKQPVKWVARTGMHLTLKFLGDVESTQVAEILGALTDVTQRCRKVTTLRLSSAGAFPGVKRPQILWVGVEGDLAALSHLQQQLEQALEPLGFAPEGRPFRAHLTLGRVRQDASAQQRASLGDLLAKLPAPPPVAWTPDAPVLFQSTLMPTGAIYTRIDYVES